MHFPWLHHGWTRGRRHPDLAGLRDRRGGLPIRRRAFHHAAGFLEDWPEVRQKRLTSTFHPSIHPETGSTSLAAMGLVRGSKEKVSERSCNDNDNPYLTLRTILDAAVHFFTKSAHLQQTRTSNAFSREGSSSISKRPWVRRDCDALDVRVCEMTRSPTTM